jgi:hypothetical protein
MFVQKAQGILGVKENSSWQGILKRPQLTGYLGFGQKARIRQQYKGPNFPSKRPSQPPTFLPIIAHKKNLIFFTSLINPYRTKAAKMAFCTFGQGVLNTRCLWIF